MPYRIVHYVSVFDSPIDVNVEGKLLHFKDGKELAETEFEKNYSITKISAESDHFMIELEENNRVNNINWIGEEEVSFY